MQGATMEGPKHNHNGAHEFAGSFFEIFQVEAEGVIWRGAAATFEDATKRIQELASALPADYIVLNRKTGNKHLIKSGSVEDRVGTKQELS